MKPRSNKSSQRQRGSARATSQPGTAALAWRAGGFAVALLCAVMLLLGATEPEDSAQDSRKKIEAMTPAERAQLKRNYEKFQKLTPEEKARYHKIHEAIRNQPELKRVMHSYEEWVRTLSPWEQEDLRKAQTPEARMALIRKIRSEHQDKNRWKRYRRFFDVLDILEIEYKRNPGLLFMTRVQSPSPELFREVVGVIEKNLPEPVDYPKSNAERAEFQRSLAVLKAAGEVKQRDDQKGSDWPRPEVVDQVFQLIEQDQYHFFRDKADRRGEAGNRSRWKFFSPDQKRALVTLFLAKGLMHQLILTVTDELERMPVPEEQLQKFFESLDRNRKEDLLKHPPEELQERLKFMYLKAHLPEQVESRLAERSRETQRVAMLLASGGGQRFLDGGQRRGNGLPRNRFPNLNNRRPNGPGGRGEGNFRERDPDRKPGKERVRPRPAQPDA